jgi:hypothetical protein
MPVGIVLRRVGEIVRGNEKLDLDLEEVCSCLSKSLSQYLGPLTHHQMHIINRYFHFSPQVFIDPHELALRPSSYLSKHWRSSEVSAYAGSGNLRHKR